MRVLSKGRHALILTFIVRTFCPFIVNLRRLAFLQQFGSASTSRMEAKESWAHKKKKVVIENVRSLPQVFSDFCQNTSGHGFQYWVSAGSFFERLLWIGIVVSGFTIASLRPRGNGSTIQALWPSRHSQSQQVRCHFLQSPFAMNMASMLDNI